MSKLKRMRGLWSLSQAKSDEEREMYSYYLNRNSQLNGDHEVHRVGCPHMPLLMNSLFLGNFYTCAQAMAAARRVTTQADGCFYCCTECHTS